MELSKKRGGKKNNVRKIRYLKGKVLCNEKVG